MLEPLSPHLQSLLFEHQLCSPADLRRCRRRVRLLAADLPAFDSVWLDALVQLGRLTPFQVRILESADPRRIAIGPCVLVDQIGQGPHSRTFLGWHGNSNRRLALKLLHQPAAAATTARVAWQRLIEGLRKVDSAAVVGPQFCEMTERGLLLISPFVSGPNLHELLVRRGRFAPSLVIEIGRQLIEGLVSLERERLVHGDIRLANIRLSATGRAVLVDPGIRPVLDPEETVHSGLPPDRYDGTAPELIGTSQPSDIASDLYSLGCLFWQLLAGRPPYPGGDPLIKLGGHRSRDIDDVRVWAPETPVPLALMIHRLTRRDRRLRPATCTALQQEWARFAPARPALLMRFRKEFDSPRPLPRNRSAAAWSGANRILLATLAAACVFALWNPGRTRNWLARNLDSGTGESANNHREQPGPGTATAHMAPVASGPQRLVVQAAHFTQTLDPDRPEPPRERLPVPDKRGVVSLSAEVVYSSRPISVVGHLIIRGPDRGFAEIVVDKDWPIVAESVRFERIRVRASGSGIEEVGGGAPLIDIQSQAISAEQMSIRATTAPVDGGDQDSRHSRACLRWRLVDDRDTRPTVAAITDCAFLGGRCGLEVAGPVSVVQFSNCLSLAQSATVQVTGSAPRPREMSLRFEHATCRQVDSVVHWLGGSGPPTGMRLAVEFRDCLLDLRSETGALLVLGSEKWSKGWIRRIRVTGEGSLIHPETALLAWRSTVADVLQPVDATELDLEGLLASPIEFRGPLSTNPVDSEAEEVSGPRRSGSRAGVRADRIPGAGLMEL